LELCRFLLKEVNYSDMSSIVIEKRTVNTMHVSFKRSELFSYEFFSVVSYFLIGSYRCWSLLFSHKQI
jgi:hypothetical protein